MTGPRYACWHCGYGLDAVPTGPGGITCPECGHVEPSPTYALAPWPAAWRVAVLMLWPTSALTVILVILLTLTPLTWMLVIGWPLALMAWTLAALIHPMFEAGELARHHALIPDRWRVRTTLGAAALFLNAVVTFFGLWIFEQFG